jgi:ABC-2 type transport system permease protein
VLLLSFVSFLWGVGVCSAAAVLTFRRGSGLLGYVTMTLAFLSGAYIPLSVLPDWVLRLQVWNPVAATLAGVREALIGDSGWAVITPKLGVVMPVAAGAFVVGIVSFRFALRRELHAGTLGQY